MEYNDYDRILVAFSGGKDSVACVLHLLQQGVDRAKIELHHHLVDGREGSTLMDWPVTESYCQAFASAFGLPLLFSWKHGGFEREMLRLDSPTAPISWENPDGTLSTKGGDGPQGTRLRFPQVTANLAQRWCSAYIKIDVLRRLVANSPRLHGKKILIVSGERAEESAARACYATFEPDASDNRRGRKPRHIDRARPILHWTEKEVWAIMERHSVNPHPCYHLGWGRCSCRGCIFGNANQFASLAQVDPEGTANLIATESALGCTIKRKGDMGSLIQKGTPYEAIQKDMAAIAMSQHYTLPIILPAGEWKLPAGAFGESNGPT
jgi:3'-phosphoadenosine 5'-phosphosulfate sulfotransferase (PAPS reductase)/FAD synthetase